MGEFKDSGLCSCDKKGCRARMQVEATLDWLAYFRSSVLRCHHARSLYDKGETLLLLEGEYTRFSALSNPSIR
jgi:hypothetical protein